MATFRVPGVAAKISSSPQLYLDDDTIQNRITQDFYDVPVRELVHWGLL